MDIRSEIVICDVIFDDNIPIDFIPTVECALRSNSINVLKHEQHLFPNGGETHVYLLSASHLAIHTWPESNYVSLDVYTCSGEGSAVQITNDIIYKYNEKIDKINIRKLDRGSFEV